MKILVLSDSHGNVDNMARAVELTRPRHILHLGDCLRDAQALHERFPDIPMDTVPGNCDWGSFDAPERLLGFDGVRVLMMHGHTRNVKSSPLRPSTPPGSTVRMCCCSAIPTARWWITTVRCTP